MCCSIILFISKLILFSILINIQAANLRQAFANNLSTDIKLSQTQLSKIIQSGGFLGIISSLLPKTGLPLIKNVTKPLAKSILIPLELTASESAAYARIHKKPLVSGTTRLIISNDKMEEIMKIVKILVF